MRFITRATLLVFAVTGGTALPAGAQQSSTAPAQTVESLDAAKVSSRADGWLGAFEQAGDFSGVVVLAQGDKVLFEKAYGFADTQVHSPNRPETRFRVASLSKTFTAAAIEQLANQGKLRYSDSLSRYVEGMPNGESITIEQLLTHQSGIGVLDSEDIYRDCISHDDLLRRLAAAKPLFAPGKQSAYSNEGYFLLAAVVERASGTSYEAFLRQNIFAPLQMENGGVACRDLPAGRNAFGSVATASEARLRPLPYNEAALDGAGSVYSNAEDLLRWLRAVDTSPAFGVNKLSYPYAWGKRKYGTHDLIEQSGQLEGFISHVAIYPREHIYAIVLGNIQSGFSQRIAQDLQAVLFGGQVSTPPAVTTILLGERSMRQYLGRYHSKEIAYPQTLAIRDGQLAMHWGEDPFWREMVMTDGDTFFLRAEYAQIHFERGPDGAVHRMVWNWPGGARLAFDKDQILEDNAPNAPVNP
jgi:CubicO group peptidase (beta-lactamase class C family)